MSLNLQELPRKNAGQIAPGPIDLAAIRARLAKEQGQHYWRSLEELAETPEFTELLRREFQDGATEWCEGLSRRSFLKMAAATLALSGLTACTKQPVREILPYVKQPTELVLGQALFYATSMSLGGFATGVLVKNREGHPIKVDGNPEHPASLGGSSVWLQASLLDLYDPDRSQTVMHQGDISTWELVLSDLNELLREANSSKGIGLRFLTETVTSPTLTAQLEDLLKRYPGAKWHQYEPISRDNVHEGARLAFGSVVDTQYHFDKAAVILSLDSDFLHTHPERLRYARQFTNGRRIAAGKREMNRLYVLESTPTITGTMAEHRLPIASGEIEGFAKELVRELASGNVAGNGSRQSADPEARPVVNTVLRQGAGEAPALLYRLAQDLKEHPGTSIVIAGEWQPPIVHALAHWLNEVLGNVGKTVHYMESAEAQTANGIRSLSELAEDSRAGKVSTLFILGGNPVYTAPADLEFNQCLAKIRRSIHLGLDLDETAALCTWHIPQAHYLESWSDARSFDGTVSLVQPLIAPLYGGRSAHEILGAMVQQQPIRSDYELVRDHWRGRKLWPEFELGWRRALHEGVVAGTGLGPKPVQLRVEFAKQIAANQPSGFSHENAKPGGRMFVELASVTKDPNETGFLAGTTRHLKSLSGDIEINFRPDPHIWDGRFANNGWLQECPKPVSKLTWDNVILVSPAIAEMGGLSNGDVVSLAFDGRSLEGPVWVMPGQARNAVTIHLGYGRKRIGRVGAGVGFNAYAIRPAHALWFAKGARITTTGRRHQLVTTQIQHNVQSPDRQIYRCGTLTEFLANPNFVKESVEIPPEHQTLYNTDEYQYRGYKWGMSIDLTTCIGCNACVVACEAENNIPVVGKDQVGSGRDMHWLRVDTYYQGSMENPGFNHMPVPCMHCEHAPCELVCPVAATLHDAEGLNLQVYNRCVGTRFCSNNCPYKVRRFNFLRYAPYDEPQFKPMYNPEVTVRWRGVMEKCTYCVQRISAGRIHSEKENRRIRDGEVRTACQEACPTEAIVFGDLNDPNSKVALLKKQELDFPMLGQLNTRPRTTYLAKLQNPHEDIMPGKA